jgi:hypothetical protein
VVDNDSTDGSDRVAREFGAVIVDIPKSEFTYGRALNIGIAKATGDIVVLLSAHAVPVGSEFLSTILSAMADPNVAGVRCLHAGKIRELKEWWNRPTLDNKASSADAFEYGTLNNGAAIRRSVWSTIPYDENIEACEDKVWSHQATQAGFKIAPCSAVYVYIKKLGPARRVQCVVRERVAAYRYGGVADPQSSADLIKSVFVIWQDAVQNTYCQILNHIRLRSLTRLAKQYPEPGSVQ